MAQRISIPPPHTPHRSIETTLLDPAVVERAVAHAEATLALDRSAERRTALEQELADATKAAGRLTAAIAAGGELAPLVAAVAAQEDRRKELEAQLAALRNPETSLDPAAVRRQLLGYLDDWRGLLRGQWARRSRYSGG